MFRAGTEDETVIVEEVATGRRLLTAKEEAEARESAERRAAEAEAENRRLRRELARLRGRS